MITEIMHRRCAVSEDRGKELLERYNNQQAFRNGDFKNIMRQYFEAVDEYTAKNGKPPAPVIFNLNNKSFKSDDDDFPFKVRSLGLDRDR